MTVRELITILSAHDDSTLVVDAEKYESIAFVEVHEDDEGKFLVLVPE